MTYYDYLCRLLEPMRVYRTERGTLSGGELYAAGAVLDEVDGAMEYAEQEGVLQTAEGEGLARREKLFSRCPVSVSTALRREAIAALARINADSFTLDAINSTLSGCGIKALAEETEKKGTVKVWFPNTVGVPDEFSQVESIIQMGNDYLRIVTIGSLGMFCQIMYERLLQGTGRSILSMYTQGLGAIINIILDPIFIFGLKMGVAGAAVATIIGQFCGFALAVWFNHRKNTDITLSLRGFRPDFRLIGEIYAIGLPSVIMIAIGSVMTFLMNKILITYHAAHETAATAFGVYLRPEQRRDPHRGLQLRRSEPPPHDGHHQAQHPVRLLHHGVRHGAVLGHTRYAAAAL